MAVSEAESARSILIRRHSGYVRVTHWINLACLVVLLGSGMQIFNAHPALYFGNHSAFSDPSFAMRAEEEDGKTVGRVAFGHFEIPTTGFLGASAGPDGTLEERGFPSWLTIPSYQDLATGRRWHFFFAWLFVANGLVYLAYTFLSGHVWRDLAPGGRELRGIGASIREHARLHFPHGEEARHYNVLQKLAYLIVIFILLPLMVATGMTMSPGLDAAFPWLVQFFGGRQTARTIHFISANLIVLFVFVHVVMVILSGPFNNLRSMITGNYRIAVEPHGAEVAAEAKAEAGAEVETAATTGPETPAPPPGPEEPRHGT